MQRYFRVLFVLAGISLFGMVQLHAQGGGSRLEGVLQNEAGEPLVFAPVALCSPEDSTIFGGTNTDENGRFTLPVDLGAYLINIKYMSYEEKWISGEKEGRGATDLGTILMQPKSIDLDAVDITAERNLMEFKLDKRVYNVSQDLSNLGSNAQEILENVPSVTVDVDGNVALRGSENVRILIDGKQSGLTGIKDQDALRNLQGNMIDKIEVVTNPSAKYDAEGEAGIINIVLKKKQQKGLNGSFDLTAGYPENFGAGLNLNWRRKKINLFTNASLNYRNSPGGGTYYQEFKDSTGSIVEIYQSTQVRRRGGFNGQFQLGTDIFLDKYSTLTFAGLYQGSRGRNSSSILYEDLNENLEVINTSTRTDDEEEPGTDIEATLNYTRKFPQKDRSWTVDLKYTLNDDTESNDFVETFGDGSPNLIQRGLNTEDQSSYLIQTDYYHPIGKKGKLEMGLKGTLRDISNDFTVEQLVPNNEWQVLGDFDNQLRYQENIYAAYAIYGNEYKKVSYSAGLRMEYSDIGTELVETAEVNNRDYNNFFPSAAIAYQFDEKNQLQVSYSRRITRPSFRSLLPFVTYNNSRLIWQGNPNLDPELTDSYEMGYLRYFEKGSLLSSVYYRYGTNVIRRINVVEEGISNIFPVNLGFDNSFGLEFNMNYDLYKWWQVTGNMNFFRSVVTGDYEGVNYDAEAITMTARGSTKFTLPNQLRIQTSFNYQAPQNTTQGRRLAFYSWDIGANKKILKKKGSLAFSVRDVLNSRKRRSIIEGDNFYATSTFQWRLRQFTLSFNYQLNQNGPQKRERGSGYEGGGEDF